MKFTKMLLLGLFALALISTSCSQKCGFEFGSRGEIKKFVDGPQNGGEYYIGNASSFAGHSVLVTSDPSIDLEALYQAGETVVVHCNYIREQAANNQLTPRLVDVIHVHDKDFLEE